MRFENGRRVDLNTIPDSGVFGDDIIKDVGSGPGRRVVMEKDGVNQTVNPNRRLSREDLIDRKGRPVKILNIPDRTKGALPCHQK